jgi:hydroxymethylpyrimidine pyrophosphatase-like HAD family hydrolase
VTQPAIAYAAVDLDGTILDPHGTVPEEIERGLGALREHGVRLLIATGRSPFLLSQLRLSPSLLNLFEPAMVLRDGDVIFDRLTQSVVLARYLPRSVVPDLVRRYPDVVCEYPGEVVATTRAAALRYALFYGFPRSAIRVDPSPAGGRVNKTIVFGDLRADCETAVAGVRYRRHPEQNRLVATPTASCKAAGLHYVLDRYYGKNGFSAVMAIGDGDNDECLLSAVEHGIAVVNAVPATAGRAAVRLSVPLAEFLAGFTGRTSWAPRSMRSCPHLLEWAVREAHPA